MQTFAYYFHHYWLAFFLIVCAAFAVFFVYRNWNRITLKGSGRK
ncbi:hypothetical protein O9H85_28040 [Paenibacillus filicis]|uniref:Uncharacterized protein n=1 Tax=Paenibacillus gyeongsangnamensis TaxID=3388067 RepID=A0ABT4QHK5_9BACL|nr:hypothetical protein [Paenibacillus filicis]MCZ8516175.1 hypothetical protein [Paenibacillus filicis]